MPFVPTGFPALDSMIAGDSECRGFPRGGLSLIRGITGSGKTTILKKICENAKTKGLRVVWVEPGSGHPENSPRSIMDLAHFMSKLLHPGNQKHRADLIVVDDVTSFETDPNGPVAQMARTLSDMFQVNLGSTAIVLSMPIRKSPFSTYVEHSPPVSIGYQSRVTIEIAKNGRVYDLKLVKSVVSHAGVSCTVNLEDLIDRSKIPTRYERILCGRN